MREELTKILSNVNDWLKFAEAKNAGLVIFNSASIVGIMQAFPAGNDLTIFKWIMIFLFGLSICISIYTFLPVLNKTFTYQKYEDAKFELEKNSLNCYFFHHHSKINCKQLLSLLKFKTNSPNHTFTDIDTDNADQIINNAEIAVSKFKLFTWAAYLTFVAVVLGLVLIIIKIV